MPYFISDKNPDCSGWAVEKEDGTVMGCHQSKQDAVDQMVAVSLAEDMAPGGERTANAQDVVIVDIDGTLIAGGQGIQKNVDYVNALYEKFFIYIVTGRGIADQDKTIAELADAGVKYDDLELNEDLSIPTPEYKGNKAADILSEQTVVLAIDNDPAARRAYFDLGIKTLDPKRIKTGDMPVIRNLSENIGEVAETTIVRMESRDLNENYVWTAHQQALYTELEDIAETFGQFDQTSGGDGAHYMAPASNPFSGEGLKCSNCAFYDGAQGCDLVAGIIEAEALCKFWIIPADLITAGRIAPVQMLKRQIDLLETKI